MADGLWACPGYASETVELITLKAANLPHQWLGPAQGLRQLLQFAGPWGRPSAPKVAFMAHARTQRSQPGVRLRPSGRDLLAFFWPSFPKCRVRTEELH
jgi:hypothetical protein